MADEVHLLQKSSDTAQAFARGLLRVVLLIPVEAEVLHATAVPLLPDQEYLVEWEWPKHQTS